jgi:hypothetical protein
MVSSDTNKPKARGSWKKILLFSFTLLRLIAVPALNALDSSSATAFHLVAGAACDHANCPISTETEFRNVRGNRTHLERAGQSR